MTKINGRYTFTDKKEPADVGGIFDGETVVFTGYRDKDAAAKIEAMGGRVGSSVSGKTTLVVTKDPTSNSGKVKKAKDLGIKVIGPEELGGMFV